MADLWFPHSDTIPAAQQWQTDAWDFFGNPDDQGGDQIVGEIGYVFRWMAAQLGRLSWRVEINGEQLDADSERAAALVERVTSPTVSAAIGLNLLVAGQCSYVAMEPSSVPPSIPPTVLAGTGDTRWMVISVIDPHRAIILRGNELKIEGLRPHPANPRRPDSPARSALPILGEIRQLQDLSHAQNNSRIANTSILMVANELGLGPDDGQGGTLSDRLKQIIDAPLRNPRRTGASPIVLTGPADTIANASRLPVAWATSNQPYDNRIDQRIVAAIQRLAWTIPLPPEALLGMATTARATAFQIEDATYRSHLEPEAELLASIYSAAANAVTPDAQEVRLIPDPTDLLARRHSVQDAFDAWDRGLAASDWVRDVLGVPEGAEATADDLALLMELRGSGDESVRDPSDAAANEAVSAAPAGMVDLDAMADELARIDDELRAELRGAVEVAARRAREKVGARARSLAERDLMAMSSIAEVDNERVAAVLGADTLTTLGVNVSETVESAVGGLVEWWRGVLSTARESIVAVAGDVDADWDSAADDSVALLTERMTAWVTDTIADELGAVPDDMVRDVVAAAGGVVDG